MTDSAQNTRLEPLTELRSLTREAKRYAFVAQDRDEALRWQQECREAVMERLGFLDSPWVAPRPRLAEEADKGDYLRRKLVISTAPAAEMPVYLLIPKRTPRPLPVVLAYHGHGYGVKDIVGLREDGSERDTLEAYHWDFAVQLCRRGMLVAAPEIACFGERRSDFSYLDKALGQGEPTSCHNAATYALMLGKSVLGMRVRDSLRLVDYLSGLPEADVSRMGAMGLSGGGMLTFFHSAVDLRIKAAVISGYFSTFQDSILAMDHCTCNYVPGMLQIGEMSDLIGLILPRPVLIEAGTQDPIFPIEAVRRSVEKAKDVCSVFGMDHSTNVVLDEFDGPHMISGRLSYDFLADRLKTL